MFTYPREYDVIVLGAGHAGIEAALASARMGCRTLMLTANVDTIGQMSCNPAIGGIGKGHLAREVDALGGEMGITTDMTGLQFKMLNTKKGPSVWAPRAQCDKKAYQFRMKWVCEREPNLDIHQGQATKLLYDAGRVRGVETALGIQYRGRTLVVTTGTFLRGLMHIGASQTNGGRSGEAATESLSSSLKDVGLELGRLKTGTPPRLLRRSIDFSKMERQMGDEPIPRFSFRTQEELFHVEQACSAVETRAKNVVGADNLPLGIQPHLHDRFFHTKTFPGMGHAEHGNGFRTKYPPGSILAQINGQLPCYVTFTTEQTRKLVRDNLHLSPMYSGGIEGVGPRYCPSIEDKFVRFSEKERHQIFLEPEGIATDEIYVNGCSTSLPFEIQVQLVRSIVGCESAEILRPAYAVEYDFAYPTQLCPSLETKACENLYLAGQINGTSGYEEAAAQGLMAGINAARRVQSLDPIVLRRDQAYIGVLIDDLVTQGTQEPYRMFTSRAEYRLVLRQDNADLRLSELGYTLGLIPKSLYLNVLRKSNAISEELERLAKTRHATCTLAQALRRPEMSYSQLPHKRSDLPTDVVQQVEISLKYEGYIERQERDITRFRSMENRIIPQAINYDGIGSLRIEAREKLSLVRPETIGQASRISGVTPSDLAVLAVWIKQQEFVVH